MKAWLKDNLHIKAWGILAFTLATSFWSWSKLGTDVSNIYRLFPLLGLIAFTTMWGHYVVWALREWTGADSAKTALYSRVTHYIVLVSMILHPALLIYKLNADGLGTPPESYEAYVGKALVGYIFLGTVSLFAFIAYEFKKWLSGKKRVWQVVMGANHVAMLAIVMHAMKLGNSTKQFPLEFLMPLYGLSLICIYIYIGSKKKLV